MSVNPELALATNPMGAEATVGKDYLLYIAGIVATKESWNIIGGQTSGSIDESTDEIDVTTKTSGGYKASLPGLTTWSIDFDSMALLPGSDTGVELLKRGKDQKTQVKVKILYPDGTFRVGWASTTTYTVDTPYDKAATLKGKLSGYGPLSCQSVSVSISAATDQTTYFSKTATATSIKYTSMETGATTALTESAFATSAGQATILGTALAALTKGEYLFYISLSTGGYALFPVVITDDVTVSIAPTTATFSKAAATEKVFTVTPSGTTVSTVKNGSTTLTSGTDYTYVAGTLTIKSAYLTEQTNGDVSLTVTPGSGSAVTVTITVED